MSEQTKPERATFPEVRPLQPESLKAHILRSTAEKLVVQLEHMAAQEASAKQIPRQTLLDYIAAIAHQRFLERRVSR